MRFGSSTSIGSGDSASHHADKRAGQFEGIAESC